MKTTPIALAMLPLLLFAGHVSAERVPFTASGSFTLGSPVAFFLLDACGNGQTNGIDSSCFAIPADIGNLPYTLVETDSAVRSLGISLCFYKGATFMKCDGGIVPQGANRASVGALGGATVNWTFTS